MMGILVGWFLGLYIAAGTYCVVRNIVETTPEQLATPSRVVVRILLIVANFFVGPIGLFYRLFRDVVREFS